MIIRFDHPATVLVVFQAGDEVHVTQPSPALARLLTATRADGRRVASRLCEGGGDEVADAPVDPDMAVTGRGKPRGGQRSAPVSG